MPAASPLGESVREALDALDCVTEHPAGHSQTLLRYVTPDGVPFGIQRVEITAVRFWAGENDAFAAAAQAMGLAPTLHVPPSKSKPGRNSSLDQIPVFKGKPLHWVSVSNPGQAVAAFGLLVATTAKRAEIEAPIETDVPVTGPEAALAVPAEVLAPAGPADAPQGEPAPEPVAESKPPSDHVAGSQATARLHDPVAEVEPVTVSEEPTASPGQAHVDPGVAMRSDAVPAEHARHVPSVRPQGEPRPAGRPLPLRIVGGLLGAVFGRRKPPGA